jgi:hypothetical protein
MLSNCSSVSSRPFARIERRERDTDTRSPGSTSIADDTGDSSSISSFFTAPTSS